MITALSFLLSFFFPHLAFAQTAIGGCDPDDSVCKLGASIGSFGGTLSSIIQFIFVIAVILALGFLVYGGIKWLTSGGDKDAIASARGTIITAVAGLIIIFLAYFILNFVLLFLTGKGFESIQIPRIIGGSGNTEVLDANSALDCEAIGGTPIISSGEYVRCERVVEDSGQQFTSCSQLTSQGKTACNQRTDMVCRWSDDLNFCGEVSDIPSYCSKLSIGSFFFGSECDSDPYCKEVNNVCVPN